MLKYHDFDDFKISLNGIISSVKKNYFWNIFKSDTNTGDKIKWFKWNGKC